MVITVVIIHSYYWVFMGVCAFVLRSFVPKIVPTILCVEMRRVSITMGFSSP
jgi:hypothetical protein